MFYFPDEPLNPGSTGSVQSLATFVIQRAAGSFGPARVYWLVASVQNDTTDIAPVAGVVEFSDGDRNASFQISALADQVSIQTYILPYGQNVHGNYICRITWKYFCNYNIGSFTHDHPLQ